MTVTTLTRLLAAAQADLLDPRGCAYHAIQRPAFLGQRGVQLRHEWSNQTLPQNSPCNVHGAMSPLPTLPCDTSPLRQSGVSRRYVPRMRVVPRKAVPRQYRNPVLPHPACEPTSATAAMVGWCAAQAVTRSKKSEIGGDTACLPLPEPFVQIMMAVMARMVFKDRKHVIAQLLVEARCLKTERAEDHMVTATGAGFLFRCV
jgi:hypothetical protein